jgi:AAA15 family ATPase/GTPase
MSREIYDIINDIAEVLNASQMKKLQEVLVRRLSENNISDYLQTGNEEFLDMFLTAKHLEGCSDKTIRYYRCNIEKMLETISIPMVKITTEMLRKYLVEYQSLIVGRLLLITFVEAFPLSFLGWRKRIIL